MGEEREAEVTNLQYAHIWMYLVIWGMYLVCAAVRATTGSNSKKQLGFFFPWDRKLIFTASVTKKKPC